MCLDFATLTAFQDGIPLTSTLSPPDPLLINKLLITRIAPQYHVPGKQVSFFGLA